MVIWLDSFHSEKYVRKPLLEDFYLGGCIICGKFNMTYMTLLICDHQENYFYKKFGTLFQTIMWIIPLISLFGIRNACQLANEEIGFCASKQNLGSDSFCKNFVQDNICMPVASVAWSSYDISYRDQVIEDIFMSYIGSQLLNQYIYRNASSEVISNNRDCYDAYKQFLCEFNFPKCDQSTDTTQSVCKTVCTSYFELCLSSSQACEIIYETKVKNEQQSFQAWTKAVDVVYQNSQDFYKFGYV